MVRVKMVRAMMRVKMVRMDDRDVKCVGFSV